MAAPTIIYLSTGKVGTNGTDKSVPYDSISAPTKPSHAQQASLFPTWARRKTKHRTCVTRGNYDFARSLEPGYQIYICIRRCVNAPLKILIVN